MSDEVTYEDDIEDDEDAAIEAAALAELKARATNLGVTYHPSIGAEKLSEKIRIFLEEKAAAEEAAAIAATPVTQIPPPIPAPMTTAKATPAPVKSAVGKKRHECEALVRVIVTCMDPLKKAHRGDFFTVGNSVMQTQTLMVPFGVEHHIPRILFNMLGEKYYTTYDTKKDHFGREIKTPRQVKAFAIQVLPDLSTEEIVELARLQALEAGKSSAQV